MKSYVGEKRKVRVTREELVTILHNSTPEHPTDLSLLRPETQDLLKREDFTVGSCLLELQVIE